MTLILAGAGCTVYDTATDADSVNMDLNDSVFQKAVVPFCRAVELSDFFYRYQSVSNSSGSVDELKTSYFGEDISLTQTDGGGIYIDYWGEIRPSGTDSEAYIVTVSPQWSGKKQSFYVSVLGHRVFSVVCLPANDDLSLDDEDPEMSLEAAVSVAGDIVTLRNFDLTLTYLSYDEPLEVRVYAGTDDETVKFDLCTGGEFMMYPVAGTFYYIVSGYISNNFRVLFYGDYFEVIENEIASASMPD